MQKRLKWLLSIRSYLKLQQIYEQGKTWPFCMTNGNNDIIDLTFLIIICQGFVILKYLIALMKQWGPSPHWRGYLVSSSNTGTNGTVHS